MRIVYDHREIGAPPRDAVMTIGTFDGVHLGHQRLVGEVVRRARETGGESVVYSFYPPPWRVLGRGRHPYLITTFEDKASLLSALGVDLLVTEEFTPEVQAQDPGAFARDVIEGRLRPRAIVVGYDFGFGRDRSGDFAFLDRFFRPAGTSVSQFPPVLVGGEPVSCSRIREAVVGGRVADAARLLGRWHFLSGAVVRGRGRGRTIGFPTANIQPRTELLPGPGVFAVRLTCDRGEWDGVANVGLRPTFAEREVSVEAHLFGFDGDLYGETVRLHFVDRVRDEVRFPDVEALKAQIRRDVEAVRSRLPLPPGPPG
ncbi:riboflavin biosynthesis protein RibF [Myxococcota bacterium]|nr:riboflavin biosynthesis protein RibF [Myxococcota bacterium]